MGLVGTWFNELGSTLTITQVQSGVLSGTYQTAVSSGCAQGTFNVVGVTDTDSGGQNVGFTVSWNNEESNCRSVTAWSGQVFNLNTGAAAIYAFWLLTQETSVSQLWAATNVGVDVFMQQMLSPEEIAEKSKIVRRSNP